MRFKRFLLAAAQAAVLAAPASARPWSRAYVRALPDSAFASVELDARGVKRRRLPHHDASGKVDRPHLLSALARWGRVKWVRPESAAAALEHLRSHLGRTPL